jgi:hypothetical protein
MPMISGISNSCLSNSFIIYIDGKIQQKLLFLCSSVIVPYIKIKNSDVMRITHKGSTSANRYLARLVKLEVLSPEGEKRGRIYRRRRADGR